MSSCASCSASMPSPVIVRSRLSSKARSAHSSAPSNAPLINSGPDDWSAAVRHRRRLLLPILGPRRHRPRDRGAVYPNLVHLLVEEAEITLDLRALRNRVGVGPHEVIENPVAALD